VNEVALSGDIDAALREIPESPGVGQFLGPERQSLVVARGASLRRWAARNLGRARRPKKGRPPTDLSGIASAFAFVETTSEFHSRLAYERLVAPLVPLERRRDLRPPGWLRLDRSERFPRIVVATGPGSSVGGEHYGPFRDRKAAERASAELHKRVPLRPCDFVFEPDPALALGLGCLFAQVRTCAAPCLCRVDEPSYRALAEEAAATLAGIAARPDFLPEWAGAFPGSRMLVLETGRVGAEAYPVVDGAVVDSAALRAPTGDFLALLSGLDWPGPPLGCDDTPWLSAWLHMPKRKGRVVLARPAETPAEAAARVIT
jgi:hypothetical protein